MKVNHYQMYCWGVCRIHWDGKESELISFRKWVEEKIPKKYFEFDEPLKGEYGKTHLSGHGEVVAWTFLCHLWTNGGGAPALGQVWKLKSNGNKVQFKSQVTPLKRSNDLLNIAFTNLDRESYDVETETEVKECVEFLKKKWREVNKRLDNLKK